MNSSTRDWVTTTVRRREKGNSAAKKIRLDATKEKKIIPPLGGHQNVFGALERIESGGPSRSSSQELRGRATRVSSKVHWVVKKDRDAGGLG